MRDEPVRPKRGDRLVPLHAVSFVSSSPWLLEEKNSRDSLKLLELRRCRRARLGANAVATAAAMASSRTSERGRGRAPPAPSGDASPNGRLTRPRRAQLRCCELKSWRVELCAAPPWLPVKLRSPLYGATRSACVMLRAACVFRQAAVRARCTAVASPEAGVSSVARSLDLAQPALDSRR
nr:unnamed protein product [Digitaria exilis]